MAKERGLRYAITQLSAGTPAHPHPFDAPEERRRQLRAQLRARLRARLRAQVRRCIVDGVEFLQLREKEIEAGELYDLARLAMDALGGTATRLLVNGRPDVAAAAGAHGVHLTARDGELRPEDVRRVFRAAGLQSCVVSISCHTLPEVEAARDGGVDYILFGPVFEKRVNAELISSGSALAELRAACVVAGSVPVLALGGVNAANLPACLEHGAAGMAGIRQFG